MGFGLTLLQIAMNKNRASTSKGGLRTIGRATAQSAGNDYENTRA